MRKYRKQVIFLGAVIMLMQVAVAQKVNQFSVKDAVDYAMANAVQVKNALLDVSVQKQLNKEITSAAFPQLNANGSFTNYLDIPTTLLPAEITGGPAGTYFPVTFGTKYNAAGGFDLSQLLFDGQVFVGLQARASSIRFVEKQAEVTKELIKINVQKVYYQLVVGKQQKNSIVANIERFEKLLSDTKEIYKNGFAEKLDVDKVSVQLNNLKTEDVKIQNRLDAGNAGLKFLLNMPQQDVLILTDSLSDEKLKENILDTAPTYTNRKEYQLLEEALQLGRYNIKRYKLSYLPTVSAFYNYSKNAQRTKFDFFKGGPWFTTSLVGLRLNVPIFDGFAKRARLTHAKLEVQRTENNIAQLKNSIDRDVAQSQLNITSALLTLDNQRKNMQLAEQVYNTTKKKFEQGLGSNQEIYNAQAELKVAQTNYYSAVYDAIIARIDYLSATGKLN
ncbi:MAG: TolC family protein [Ferruginibacter sp.]